MPRAGCQTFLLTRAVVTKAVLCITQCLPLKPTVNWNVYVKKKGRKRYLTYFSFFGATHKKNETFSKAYYKNVEISRI